MFVRREELALNRNVACHFTVLSLPELLEALQAFNADIYRMTVFLDLFHFALCTLLRMRTTARV